MFILAALFFLAYFVFLTVLIVGWLRGRNVEANQEILPITVVVPVRNEEKYLKPLLDRLLAQDFPQFDVIIVDDHSTDSTAKIAESFLDNRIKVLRNSGVGKKQAISTAIAVAKGDIIVTVDGDCLPEPHWLNTLHAFFTPATKLVAGPVRLTGDGLFAAMQQIEFASLVGTTCSMINLGMPVMCNGANLAYRKQVFMEVGGFKENDHIPSGDDEFLLRKIQAQHPGSVRFAHTSNAMVSTPAQASVGSFLQQRFRWASKWRFNSSPSAVALAVFVFIFQVFVLTGLVEALRGSVTWSLLLVIKLVFEAIVLSTFCRFLRLPWNWLAFIALQFIYPAYVLIVVIGSLSGTYLWKGRKYGN